MYQSPSNHLFFLYRFVATRVYAYVACFKEKIHDIEFSAPFKSTEQVVSKDLSLSAGTVAGLVTLN
jgi:hypothetical protein